MKCSSEYIMGLRTVDRSFKMILFIKTEDKQTKTTKTHTNYINFFSTNWFCFSASEQGPECTIFCIIMFSLLDYKSCTDKHTSIFFHSITLNFNGLHVQTEVTLYKKKLLYSNNNVPACPFHLQFSYKCLICMF